MTTQQAARRHVGALYGAVFNKRINREVGTGGREPALRAEIRTKRELVGAYKKQKKTRCD